MDAVTPREFLLAACDSRSDACILWPFSTRKGYGRVRSPVTGQHVQAHAFVCEVVYGPRPPGADAAHGPCHQRLCIAPRHLSWKSRTENNRDKARDGTDSRGARNVQAKLTEEQAAAILESPLTQRAAASVFGISKTQVGAIRTGKKWAHLRVKGGQGLTKTWEP